MNFEIVKTEISVLGGTVLTWLPTAWGSVGELTCESMECSFTVGPVRRGGPEPGRIGIPCEIAWNESSR